MSLMNVWIEPDRATVAVDTTGISSIHGKVSLSKLVPLVHMNAVIAGRGNGGLIGVLYSGVCRMPITFDDMAAHMPKFLADTLIEYERAARLAGYEPDQVSTVDQVAFVGWSESEDRMVGWLYLRGVGERTFTQRRIRPWVVMPGEPFTALPDTPKSHADHLRIGRQQTRWHRSALPGRAIGGDMIVAELDKVSMAITNAGDLDED